MTDTNRPSELSIIPRWAWLLAAAVFLCAVVAWCLFAAVVARPETGSLAASVFFVGLGIFLGALLAGVVLLTGYVHSDAKRRGMRARLWTILVLVIPHGLGFVVYFLVRPPLGSPCPGCGALAPRTARYCAACGVGLGVEDPREGRHHPVSGSG